MQPYMFPYIGYFQLISCVDKWVVFDDTQYLSKGWVNRNRILHPDKKKEWQYFTVPIKKHSRDCKIKDIEINNGIKWQSELTGKLSSYKRKAPYYGETINFIDECMNREYSSLSECAMNTLELTCEYLSIPFNYTVFSEMHVNKSDITHAGQWALEIANFVGADVYVNPQGGHEIFNEKEFIERNIELQFLRSNLTPYIQRSGRFIAGLSIVDVMMWNDKNAIRDMLADYEIVTKSCIRGIVDGA